MILNKIKILMCVFFFIVGIVTFYFTYGQLDKESFVKHSSMTYGVHIGDGIDSANDGVATGFGIISGFSFLSFTLLLKSLDTKKYSKDDNE